MPWARFGMSMMSQHRRISFDVSHLDQGVPKADAMQLTRQAFLRGQVRLIDDQLLGPDDQPLLTELTPTQQRRVRQGLQNPFYWAGISLMGAPW